MPEQPQSNSQFSEPSTPRIKQREGISLVWLVPLIAAAIGGWLVVKTLYEQGPQITISFKTADGIEASKTRIRYKNVEIGVVESVEFEDNFDRVILRANMDKNAEVFLRRGTSFWVVKPRLSLRGVSGLGTLVSGSYIEIKPGQGIAQKHYKGLEVPPVVRADDGGRKIVLMSDKLGSIFAGSPVYYHGIQAGEVLGYELGNDQKSLFIHVYIDAPYADFIQSNSRFWNVSGIDVSLNADGLSLRTESIQSLLIGGIAFETPENIERVDAQELDGIIFTMHDSYQHILDGSFTKKIRFVLFFEGSVRGLTIGAPVEFKGIKVGSVVGLHLEFDESSSQFNIPVIIEIEPERVIARKNGTAMSPLEILQTLVERGLRARLQTGSLLTGQLLVEMDMHPDTPIRLVSANHDLPELPTIKAQLDEMATSVTGLLENLNKVDFKRTNDEFIAMLKDTRELVQTPELKIAMSDLSTAMEAFKRMVVNMDDKMEPFSASVIEAAAAGRKTLEKSQVTLQFLNASLEKSQTTMGLLNESLKPESPLQYRFIQMAEEIAETARSVRFLMDYLERNPEAVIFGKAPPGGK